MTVIIGSQKGDQKRNVGSLICYEQEQVVPMSINLREFPKT